MECGHVHQSVCIIASCILQSRVHQQPFVGSLFKKVSVRVSLNNLVPTVDKNLHHFSQQKCHQCTIFTFFDDETVLIILLN